MGLASPRLGVKRGVVQRAREGLSRERERKSERGRESEKEIDIQTERGDLCRAVCAAVWLVLPHRGLRREHMARSKGLANTVSMEILPCPYGVAHRRAYATSGLFKKSIRILLCG